EKKLNGLEEDVYANLSPWNRVQMARHQKRPTTLDYIGEIFTDFIEFHGDRYYGDDEAIVSGIAFYNDEPITVIGHQRGKAPKEKMRRNYGMGQPEGLRKRIRPLNQAQRFDRPLICFIDTQAPPPGKQAAAHQQRPPSPHT